MRTLLCLAIALATPHVLAAEPTPAAPPETAAATAPAPAKEAAAAPEEPAAAAEGPKADAAKAGGEAPAADAKPRKKAPAAPAVPEPVDDQARFLAGLPVAEGSPLFALQQTKFWKAYAKKFDADWGKLKKERLDAMSEWSARVLSPRIDPKAPLYYLFGGPDFLSVPVLYPQAPVYILGGLEPVGKVPLLASLGAGKLESDMRNLRLSLNSIMKLSFFKTNDMRDDLVRTDLVGVLPVLFVFAARSGAKLVEVARVEIDPQGEIQELGAKQKGAGVPGVRLRLQRPGGDAVQELFYFKHDVSNDVVKASPGFFAFFKKHAPANTFLKAASFLLHRQNQFKLTREFLLENSKSVLQDDSGVPFASLAGGPFDLTLFGVYLKPRAPFLKKNQPDMTEAFKKGPVEPLPFVTGYRRVGEANLVLAVTKGAAAAPAPAP